MELTCTIFDWRESGETNFKRMATRAARSQGLGIKMDTELKAHIILANIEWVTTQEWGQDINTT